MSALFYYTVSTKNEFLKLKRTFAFWLCILSSIFIPVIYFIYYSLKYKSLIPAENVNPWDKFLSDQVTSAGSLLVPMFIVLITSLIIQIEHKSLGIKYLFSLPIPKSSIYFGKLTAVIGMILFTYISFFILMLLVGMTVGLIHNELNFLEFSPNYAIIIKLLFRSFVTTLGILGIQFWLSFRIKNFIIPLGIGIVLVLTGLIIYRAEESVYFPYAYNILSMFALRGDVGVLYWLPKVSIYSLIYFSISSVLGYIDVKRMNIK